MSDSSDEARRRMEAMREEARSGKPRKCECGPCKWSNVSINCVIADLDDLYNSKGPGAA